MGNFPAGFVDLSKEMNLDAYLSAVTSVYVLVFIKNSTTFHLQLLMPHTRYTLQINIMARDLLISQHGIIEKVYTPISDTKF